MLKNLHEVHRTYVYDEKSMCWFNFLQLNKFIFYFYSHEYFELTPYNSSYTLLIYYLEMVKMPIVVFHMIHVCKCSSLNQTVFLIGNTNKVNGAFYRSSWKCLIKACHVTGVIVLGDSTTRTSHFHELFK